MSRKTINFKSKPAITSYASVVGKMESEGPLAGLFDGVSTDSKFGMDTWEKAEAEMVRECCEIAIKKSNKSYDHVDLALAGDLTNQCAASTFGIKDKGIPYVGLYGACSTFALSLGMASCAIECGFANVALAGASSHFCTAERQYRFPLEYGCQRPPSAQNTVTGAGFVLLEQGFSSMHVTGFLAGIIRDYGIQDANNMGAAMAPSCADTICRYFLETKEDPKEYDLILSGDLGAEGHKIMIELCKRKGLDLSANSTDCGKLIYDPTKQEVNSGGSGCGCSASVFCSLIGDEFRQGKLRRILLIGTGALLNANTVLQKESIPSISHLIRIEGVDT